MNTQNGTCTYATAGTFTPRCTINGNLTSAACQGTVTVTSVPPAGFQLALKKFVNTGAGNNDAQTAASGSTAVK